MIPPGGRCILHVDMDAFFASVEQRDFPELKGKPVVVGGSPDGRGVVSAASYEARKYGIHSAMPLRQAYKRCPHAVFQPGRMQAYKEASRQIFEIFEHYTPLIQGLSVDEAFLDVSGALHLWGGDARKLAEALREEIQRSCHLTASVGIAPNKFLAKLASDIDKPDGLTEVPFDPEEIPPFLAPLPIGRIWGVGKKTEQRLRALGLHTVEDVQRCPEATLKQWLGENGAEHLRRLSFGRDERPVREGEAEKSISAEHTYDEDQIDPEVWHHTLLQLSEKVGRRLRKAGLWAGGIQIKVRTRDFKTYTRQRALDEPTQRDLDLLAAAQQMLDRFDAQEPLRLLGVGARQLTDHPEFKARQLDLFEAPEAVEAKEAKLDKVLDQLRERYGRDAVQRGGT